MNLKLRTTKTVAPPAAKGQVYSPRSPPSSERSDGSFEYVDDTADGYPAPASFSYGAAPLGMIQAPLGGHPQHHRSPSGGIQGSHGVRMGAQNVQGGAFQANGNQCHDAFGVADIPDMATLDFLLRDDGEGALPLSCLSSPRYDENMSPSCTLGKSAAGAPVVNPGASQADHKRGNTSSAAVGASLPKGNQGGRVDGDLSEQMKTLEWLFTGKTCTCKKSEKETVRGKAVKDLPCCKCLMEVFMTVLDAKKASQRCGMSPTTFKKRMRKIGIKTYPSRKIRCLFRCIQNKQAALALARDSEEKRRIHDDLAKCREELRSFKEKLEHVLKSGETPKTKLALSFSGRFKRIRNRIHKTNYKMKRGLLD